MHASIIRPIRLTDNLQLASMIRKVLIESGVPKVGTAYEDPELDNMYETYNGNGKRYFVMEVYGEIVGGAGISMLRNGPDTICELQKMYFLPVARGRGLGAKMIKVCLGFAKEQGYAQCYLETLPEMIAARKLYKKIGFSELNAPIGSTGHYSCSKWMLKDL